MLGHSSTVSFPDCTMERLMSSRLLYYRLIIRRQLALSLQSERTFESKRKIACSHHNHIPAVPPLGLLFHRWNSSKNGSDSSTTVSDEQSQSDPTGGLKKHPDAEREPLPEWPGGVNPHTGERGGPRGPEPTRYGDWERKGRVSDF